ncbi:MAG TPA: DUF4384 domain-containing protein [Bryobacteraceae bacterium]|nr:DUF4384 domain-containing protein [Bryobacteraceae bacterium]
MKWLIAPLLVATVCGAHAQTRTLSQGPHRMEIMLERRDGGAWRSVDPGLVFGQGDRVRFRFRTNFDGYLYVMNYSTSGKYEQLFPREETGRDNRVVAGRDYMVPATETAFRIAGPAGYEVVYWMVTPAAVTGADSRPEYRPLAPPPPKELPKTLLPRCDDTLFRARGECIDTSAGPKAIARGMELPENLAGVQTSERELLIMRQKNTAVVASPAPLNGPVIYEFRLAHR